VGRGGGAAGVDGGAGAVALMRGISWVAGASGCQSQVPGPGAEGGRGVKAAGRSVGARMGWGWGCIRGWGGSGCSVGR